MTRRMALALLTCLLCGCSSLLPRSKESTASPWRSYQDAELAFEKVVPGETTTAELKKMALHPASNPNIVILNYSDVLRRFLANQSMSLADLDQGIRECVMAKVRCRGFEINQKSVRKHRNGSFWLDVLGFKRETHIEGWRFSGLILVNSETVVYKLTGGEPAIQATEESANPLGPVQALGQKFLGIGGF